MDSNLRKLEATMEREKKLCANVDLLRCAGLYHARISARANTPIFAASRVAGWCAYVVETTRS
jgi:citrate synthase